MTTGATVTLTRILGSRFTAIQNRMNVHTTRIHIHTVDGVSMQDVGTELREYLYQTGVNSGLCVISTSHPECAVTLCDDIDGRYSDLLQVARHLIIASNPASSGPDDRVDEIPIGAAPAAFAATSLTLPIRLGDFATGSWESILLLDTQGPASRQLDVTILGD